MSVVASNFESQPRSLYQESMARLEMFGHKARRFVTVGTAVCGLALATPEVSMAQAPSAEPVILVGELPPKPNVALSIGDDASNKDNYLNRRQISLDKGKELGATWQRTIVYPAEYKDPNGKVKVQTAIAEIKKADYKSLVTIAMNDEATPEAYSSFTLGFLQDMQDLDITLDALIMGNEVDYEWSTSGGLRPMPGLTKAATFSALFRPAYRAVKEKYPNLIVGAADLGASNGTAAIDFLREAAETCPVPKATFSASPPKQCPPLEMDVLGIHPYTQYSPDKPDPNGGLRMGSLLEFENDVTELYQQGLIRARGARAKFRRPWTMITEIGFMGGATGDLAEKNIDAVSRRRYQRRMLSAGCDDPYLVLINMHGPFYKPPIWPGHWNTPIWNATGEDLGPAKVTKQFISSPLHADCMQQRPQPAPAKVQ